MHWGTAMHQEPPQSHRTHLSPATEAAPRLGVRNKQWLALEGQKRDGGGPRSLRHWGPDSTPQWCRQQSGVWRACKVTGAAPRPGSPV